MMNCSYGGHLDTLMSNEAVLTTVEHVIEYLEKKPDNEADAIAMMYAAHKAIGPLGQVPPWMKKEIGIETQEFEAEVSIVTGYRVKVYAKSFSEAQDIAEKMSLEELRAKGVLQTEHVIDLGKM